MFHWNLCLFIFTCKQSRSQDFPLDLHLEIFFFSGPQNLMTIFAKNGMQVSSIAIHKPVILKQKVLKLDYNFQIVLSFANVDH